MLSVSNRLAEANQNVMSTASKVVLGVSVVLTVSTVIAVHLKQNWDRQVGLPEPTAAIKPRTKLHVCSVRPNHLWFGHHTDKTEPRLRLGS